MKPCFLLSLLVAVLFTQAGCSDSDNPAGSSSTPSLSMKVDGAVWQPTGAQGSGVVATYGSEGPSTLVIKGQKYTAAGESFLYDEVQIVVADPGVGTFSFGDRFDGAGTYAYFQRQPEPDLLFRYYTPADGAGAVTITKYDEANRLVSGTFSYTGVEPFTMQTVTITEGRFSNVTWSEE